ncbi:SWIM zinc finger family protein [Paenibacillus larvae]
MLKLHIPKNRMKELIKQAQLHYDPSILELGWNHFHRGHVKVLTLEKGALEAKVQEQKDYKVHIPLSRLTGSSCICSEEKPCSHMAAVLFSLYSSFGRPELLLQELKQAIQTKRRTQRSQSLKQARKAERSAKLTSRQTIGEWHEWFETKFHGFAVTHQQSFDTFASQVQETLIPEVEKWEPELQFIYQINVYVFILRKMETFYEETKSTYLSAYHEQNCRTTSADIISKLRKLFKEPKAETWIKKADNKWSETLSILGPFALNEINSPIDWLYVYRLLWWKDTLPERKQREVEQLGERRISSHSLNPRQEDVLCIALAHFSVIRKEWEKACSILDNLHERRASDFFFYLEEARTHQEWDVLLDWLRWLKPSMTKSSQDDFRLLCQYWMEVAKHTGSDQEWVEVMESLLPRSFYYYTGYLMQTKRYQQWVDLQLSNQESPLNLYTMELKAVEETDPALLLPLYHQSIERAILEKNRSSYKIAVRLLKELQEYYRILGRELQWKQYITFLSDKYARLRAFQEEFKKGKWVL